MLIVQQPILLELSSKTSSPEIQAIKLENRWNIDEASIMEGQGLNGLVVRSVNRYTV